MRACTIDGCDRPTRTPGQALCEKHYRRKQRHGDPNVNLLPKDNRPPEERWKDSYVVDKRTGCWNWTGTTSRGYGVISCGLNNNRPAHVFVYEQVVGPVPDGMELDHKCRNKSCVNPRHMDPTTHVINVRRGDAGIQNARKTECKYGHDFTPENTIRTKTGGRNCRICQRRLVREYMRRRRAKQKE